MVRILLKLFYLFNFWKLAEASRNCVGMKFKLRGATVTGCILSDAGTFLQNFSVTIVTSLYDIGREKVDGRNFSSYVQWLSKTSVLRHPMIIFWDSNHRDLVHEVIKARSYMLTKFSLPTIFIFSSFSTARYYNILNSTKEILSSDIWKKKAKYPNDITNTNPKYIIVQYSKFSWMSEGLKLSQAYWHSSGISWVDAGISRFFPTGDYTQLRKDLVSKAITEDKFMVPFGSEKLGKMFDGKLPKLDRDVFIGSNENIVSGGVFISSPGKLSLVESAISTFVSEELIQKQRIDNEQIALAVIVEANLNWFGMLPCYHAGAPSLIFDVAV